MSGRFIRTMEEKALNDELLSKEEALRLASLPAEELSGAAGRIAKAAHGGRFDMCAVTSAKGGRCSENCAFCPQSRVSSAAIRTFPFKDPEQLLEDAKRRSRTGIRHFGIVSSGRHAAASEVELACEAVRRIRAETDLIPCVSLGLLDGGSLEQLKKAGAVRLHNNLETSRSFFPRVCTSHSYDDKLKTIRAAKAAGFEVCSGGLFGMGETWEDRIDLAMTLRDLAVDSVPVNLLNPEEGTPLGDRLPLAEEEARKIVSLFRFLLPRAWIRLAAGRPYLPDSGLSCFRSGSDASITGDMLNVRGITTETDLLSVRGLGYTL